jgi:RNase H-fold protein (predicted Holliday junction resolvase)
MKIKNNPKILGLDVSTRTIGWALFDIQTQELLEMTHISPRPKMDKDDDDKLKELILKSEIMGEKLKQYVNLGIVRVVIEEPLINSNNVYTIQTLLRFNSFIFKQIYDIFGIVPEFISTYNARKYGWPEFVQENDKGKHVLFGGLPKDIDKKMLIWEKVAKREPQITWQYTKNNTLKKENFDQTDAYTCVLGFMRLKEIWK